MQKTAIKIVLDEAQLAELRLRFPEAATKTKSELIYHALGIEPPAHGGARWGAGRPEMTQKQLKKTADVTYRGVRFCESKRMVNNWEQYTGKYWVSVDGEPINEAPVSITEAFKIARPHFEQ